MPRWLQGAGLLFCLLVPLLARAGAQARLSQSTVTEGEALVLHIEVENAAGAPDLAPLARDFTVLGMESGRQYALENGRIRNRQRFAVDLLPKRSGRLEVPPLVIGTQQTPALPLQVRAAAAENASSPGLSPVFLEAQLSDSRPYVQQAVVLVLRLHYATDLYRGQLQQAAPEHASLVPAGADSRSERDVNGRRYRVLERHYLLVPERSGTLQLPAARFSGEGADASGRGRTVLRAQTPVRDLQIRPIPAEATLPWLPARALSLQLSAPTQPLRAAEAFELVLQLDAEGILGEQLPALELEAEGEAQVFAEKPQVQSELRNGQIHARQTRRFSVLPAAAGEIRLRAKPVIWWDVEREAEATARSETLHLSIVSAPADAGPAAPATADEVMQTPLPRQTRAWTAAAIAALLALILACLYWAAPACARRRALHRALRQGDLAAIARLLPALARPAAATLSELRQQLAPEAADKRQAIDLLQQALWGGGDADAALRKLRTAFAHRGSPLPGRQRRKPLLPPLYPS